MEPVSIATIVIGAVTGVMSVVSCATSVFTRLDVEKKIKVTIENNKNMKIEQVQEEEKKPDGTYKTTKKQIIEIDASRVGGFDHQNNSSETGRQNDVASSLANGAVNIGGLLGGTFGGGVGNGIGAAAAEKYLSLPPSPARSINMQSLPSSPIQEKPNIKQKQKEKNVDSDQCSIHFPTIELENLIIPAEEQKQLAGESSGQSSGQSSE